MVIHQLGNLKYFFTEDISLSVRGWTTHHCFRSNPLSLVDFAWLRRRPGVRDQPLGKRLKGTVGQQKTSCVLGREPQDCGSCQDAGSLEQRVRNDEHGVGRKGKERLSVRLSGRWGWSGAWLGGWGRSRRRLAWLNHMTCLAIVHLMSFESLQRGEPRRTERVLGKQIDKMKILENCVFKELTQ